VAATHVYPAGGKQELSWRWRCVLQVTSIGRELAWHNRLCRNGSGEPEGRRLPSEVPFECAAACESSARMPQLRVPPARCGGTLWEVKLATGPERSRFGRLLHRAAWSGGLAHGNACKLRLRNKVRLPRQRLRRPPRRPGRGGGLRRRCNRRCDSRGLLCRRSSCSRGEVKRLLSGTGAAADRLGWWAGRGPRRSEPHETPSFESLGFRQGRRAGCYPRSRSGAGAARPKRVLQRRLQTKFQPQRTSC